MIVFDGNQWWVVFKMSAPGKAYVHIFRVAIAVQFPDGRYLHGVPSRVVKGGREEVGRTLVSIFYPFKYPCTVERQIVVAALHVSFQGRVAVLISKEMRV